MSKFIIEAAGVKALAERKNVKYIRISIKQPDGQVCVSIPRRVSIDAVKKFMEQKREWIAEKQNQCRRKTQMGKGSVTLWGEHCDVEIIGGEKDRILFLNGRVVISMSDPDDSTRKAGLLDGLLRCQMEQRLPKLSEKWQQVTGVSAAEWRIRKMKTRWGSCNTVQKRVWLNVRLAMLPPECLDYVIVHELCHLYEPSHNARFWSLMDRYYPDWRSVRGKLTELSGVLYNII